MKKEFFVIAIFLIISNIAMAQWPTEGALGSSSVGGGRMHQSMPNAPNAPRAIPPFLKGDQTLAETWSSTIAAYGNNPDGMTINCFAEDSDNLYIGGDFRTFDTVVAGYIVQYNRKTGQWISMDTGFDNDVYSLAIHNGVLYAAGDFYQTYSGGTTLNYIAEWNGTSWLSVGGGMNGEVTSIAFVGDTLYAGGGFSLAGSATVNNLAYWDGQNWYEAFGGTTGEVLTLLATHDSLFVGGGFTYVDRPNSSAPGIVADGVALLQNGNWITYGNGFVANSVTFYHDTLWAGGSNFGDGYNDTIVNQMVFWNGSVWQAVVVDTNVGTNGTGEIDQLITVGDTLIALGAFSSIGGAQANGIAMYHNGTWSSLAGGLYGYGLAAIPFNGQLYVGGRYTQAGKTPAMGIASLSNGTWTSHASLKYTNVGWQTDQVNAIATTSNEVFIGGDFVTIAGRICNHVAAYDKLENKWLVLDSGVDGNVSSLAVLNDTLYVGGSFNHAGYISARHIAKYNIATGKWSAMGNGSVRAPNAIATDGQFVYAAIYNPLVTKTKTFYDYIGRWDGTQWNPFGNGLNAGYIEALAWQDSILYAAGSFVQTDSGNEVNYVAHIQSGGSWENLNDGLNRAGFALAVSGDSLYVGGAFTQADGQTCSSLAVWNNANQEWNPIGGSEFNGYVYSLAADGNGGVYAGGYFNEVDQAVGNNLVQWNGSSFVTVGSGVNNEVESLATDETALYAGGWFQTADNAMVRSLHFGALAGAGASSVSISSLPDVTSLSIYPNPASSSATISMGLAKAGNIRIEIFNALGVRVALVADGNYQTGQQEFTVDAGKLVSGIYFLRLTNDGVTSTENFVVE